ncbi:hypothetical protein IFM89_007586 [Coptis chinensis]|uniref:Pentatricopeptide repeat-containing protein n=1 Tax=Coptis chinensis TaxID=261450 RepID=A0A835GV28_9MAGN|nr:hypothetical protein IFM89_007586 [Coptis chinensis]
MAMIDGYTKNGNFEEASLAFKKMVYEEVNADQHVFCSTLGACAGLKASSLGKSLHSFIVKLGFESEIFVGNAHRHVLESGRFGEDAVRIFEQMTYKGVKPNEITVVNILRGCSHNGLVEEGLEYFNSMGKVYGVAPRLEHYSCVIDLLPSENEVSEMGNNEIEPRVVDELNDGEEGKATMKSVSMVDTRGVNDWFSVNSDAVHCCGGGRQMRTMMHTCAASRAVPNPRVQSVKRDRIADPRVKT